MENEGNNGNNGAKPLTGFGPQIAQWQTQSQGREKQSARIGADTFHSLLQGQQSGHLAKDLIQPGKSLLDILMRTVLRDDNEARDLALTNAQLDEFGLEEEKANLILPLLAARTSVNGRARLEYLQGMTGILAMPWFGKFWKGNNGNNRANDQQQSQQ